MNPFETLSLCAEIAIGITGFTGVVLVVAGRSRGASAGRDHLLLRALLSGSLVSLGLIAVAFVLDASAIERSLNWRICGAIHASTVLAITFVNGRAARRAPSPNMPGGTALLVGTLAVVGLQLANTISLHQFWPFLIAVWWGLAVSTFAFVTLLFRTLAAQQGDEAGE